ncbi:hypothetical protein ACUXST_002357 [Sphingomonas sp. F9_3S_D5_B_2]
MTRRRRTPFMNERTWRVETRYFLSPPGDAPAAPLPQAPASSFGSDLKLFAMTFLAGFLFVSILLA